MAESPSNRRNFLTSIGKVALGCGAGTLFARGAFAQALKAPAAPTDLRFLSNPVSDAGSKIPLELTDLSWAGMCHAPDTGYSYCSGTVAVRYVNGQRRLLLFKYQPLDANYSAVGSLAEVTLPPLAGSLDSTQPVTEVRSWSNWTWTPSGALVPQLANGWTVGGLWWDDAQQVIWYTMYPIYGPNMVMPFLGATRLNDDGTVTKFGPWYYIDQTNTRFRTVCQWIIPIPDSALSSFGGRTHLFGAVGLSASGTGGSSWGPMMTALQLPSLTSTSPVSAGKIIANYCDDSAPWPNYHCHREPDYDSVNQLTPSSAIPKPVNGIGFWASSLDRASGLAWIDTNSKSGLLMFGQRPYKAIWYGHEYDMDHFDSGGNVTSFDPLPGTYNGIAVTQDALEPSQGSTGYHASAYRSVVLRFNTADLTSVATNNKSPLADSMVPAAIGQWAQYWPGIPSPEKCAYTTGSAVTVWDRVANQLIWVQPKSKILGYARLPTIQVFNLPS